MILTPMKAKKDDLDNIFTESFLYDRFKLLMLNQFKWTGPEKENIQERHIEEYLFENGYCLFFEDPHNGKMCLPCYGHDLNVYGDYLNYTATGFNYTFNVSAENSVLVENNKLRMCTHKAVLFFVERLFELVRTMDVNVRQLKIQTLFTATDDNVLTVKKIIDEIDNNNWAIVVDKMTINPDEIVKAVQTGVKCLTPELTDRYNAVMNEALTYFGINNSNTDKRERLITDEANANNQFIDSCAEMFLESRKRACEEINKKFGLNWSVELRNKREEVTTNDNSVQEVDTE